MSSFHGLCSFPHGTQNSVFLWLSIACALICTNYSIASCRLFTLQFHSALGNFEDHFTMKDATSITPEQYQVGVGLFTWMRPSFYVDGDDDSVTRAQVGNWREGSCVGYNTLQLERVLDDWWEATRILGVFSVLISWSVFLFCLIMSCLSIANWQRYLLAMSCLAVALVNGMVLLMNQSVMCNKVGNTEGFKTTCEWDQGALVAVAAVILWVCSALLAFCFIEPFREPGYEAAKRKELQDKKRAQRIKQKEKELKKQQKQTAKEKKAKTVHASFSVGKPSKSAAKDTAVDDEESKRAVKSKRQSSKRQSSKKAVASTPTLHDDDDEESQISGRRKSTTRKSSLQRGFEKRNSRRESSNSNMVPPNVEEDYDYDCVPLRSGNEPNHPRNASCVDSDQNASNPIKDYLRERSEQHERDPRASLSSQRQGSTAGEILIDLKSADSAITPRSSSRHSQGSRQRNGSIKSKQSLPAKEQPPRAVSTQRQPSFFQTMERMLFFTDVPDACGGGVPACQNGNGGPPKEFIEVEANHKSKNLADDISQLTGSTTGKSHQQRRSQQVRQARQQDLAVQKPKTPFACDPGC